MSVYTQSVMLRRKTGANSWGEPTFAPDETIKVRWEEDMRLVRNAAGDEIVSEARVFSASAIVREDVLVRDGVSWTVISGGPQYDLSGVLDHYEVRL